MGNRIIFTRTRSPASPASPASQVVENTVTKVQKVSSALDTLTNVTTTDKKIAKGPSSRNELGSQINLESKTRVVLSISKINISYVDLFNERFTSDIFLRLTWKRPERLNENSQSEEWKPHLYIENMLGDFSNYSTSDELETDEHVIVQQVHVAGTFLQPMKWKYFPFDFQNLSYDIRSRHPREEIDLVLDTETISETVISDGLNNEIFVYGRKTKSREVFDKEFRKVGVHIELMARRKTTFYIISYFFFEFLFTLTPILLLTTGNKAYQRVTVCILSVATSVFFKNLISVFSPQTKFIFTAMDTYHLGSLSIQVLVLLYLNLSNAAESLRYLDMMKKLGGVHDYIAAIFLSVLLFLFNVVFSFLILLEPDRFAAADFFLNI